MAGLPRYLYPVSETSSDPLIGKDRDVGEGIEVEETASGYHLSADAGKDEDKDALTNSTTFGGKDSSMSSSSQSGSMSSNSAITLSGENNDYSLLEGTDCTQSN